MVVIGQVGYGSTNNALAGIPDIFRRKHFIFPDNVVSSEHWKSTF